MIISTQITHIKNFSFIDVLVFNLLNRKFCFLTEKTIETVKK